MKFSWIKKKSRSSHLKSKYYIRQGHRTDNPKDPVLKPGIDLFHILDQCGYKSLNLSSDRGSLRKIVGVVRFLANLAFRIPEGSILVFNLPANYRLMKLVFYIANYRKVKLVVHCFDIPSIRYQTPMALSMQDRDMMNRSDIVLTPSANSESILRPLGLNSVCIPVEVWDYIHPGIAASQQGNGKVVFAGNPRKATFLSSLGELETRFSLWTVDYKSKDGNVASMGRGATPEDLNELAQNSWGLVWDGESIDGNQTGALGNYTRVMTTHKGGLYLAAGLPIIVWSKGGMAPFVSKYQVGICVDSLRELDISLLKLSLSQYQTYRRNAFEISRKVRSGYFLQCALASAEQSIWNS